jgi:radical SAM superfamily enzyme YgiQ (UPF0313 family)
MKEKVLLISCYELGHQPLSLAWPLAWLNQAGISAKSIDLYTDSLQVEIIEDIEFIGISVPMHTALRIGVEAAKRIREVNPKVHIAFYGLYASLNAEYLLENFADSVLSGEFEEELVSLVEEVLDGKRTINTPSTSPILNRLPFPVPNRKQLQPLAQYAQFIIGDSAEFAGYTESTRGCLHTCAHCPVVPIYQGRFFVVAFDTVMEDIRQQVQVGAKHITFGDPDFLNAPGHAVKIVKALRQEFPNISYSFTVKVEHILHHKELFSLFKDTGCAFVVTAFESVNDDVLARLGKGHSRQDMETALGILSGADITPHTTWMPFTPWTSIEGYLELLDWIKRNEMISYVPAVQLSVRMLVPPKSHLLDHPDANQWVGHLDAENFTYKWSHPDVRMDELQKEIAQIAETNQDHPPYEVFQLIESISKKLAGVPFIESESQPPTALAKPIPQMTEHWFC